MPLYIMKFWIMQMEWTQHFKTMIWDYKLEYFYVASLRQFWALSSSNGISIDKQTTQQQAQFTQTNTYICPCTKTFQSKGHLFMPLKCITRDANTDIG